MLSGFRIMRIKEAGLNDRYITQYDHATHARCLPRGDTRQHNLGFFDIIIPFQLIIFGFGIAVAMLVVERAYFIQ